MLLRTGKLEEALSFASDKLAGRERRATWDHELFAVRFESAHRLGRPAVAGELQDLTVQTLRDRGYGDWMDRLVQLAAVSPANDAQAAGLREEQTTLGSDL
jgi:hypothetical protein